MIALVGLATFDKSGTGATSILQALIWVSPKRQLRNAKLTSCCASYASCAAARGAAVGALGAQSLGDDFQDPRHTRVSLPIVGKGLSKTSFMCGRVQQRRGAYCYACLLPTEVFTRRLLRKKRKKRRK
jgi:hypothetical protein